MMKAHRKPRKTPADQKVTNIKVYWLTFDFQCKQYLIIESKKALWDLIETAKLIALRDKNKEEPFKSNFSEIQQGIRNFNSFLISGNSHLDEAITAGAKTAYLAARILAEDYAPLERYKGEDVSDLNIENQQWNFLNKLK